MLLQIKNDELCLVPPGTHKNGFYYKQLRGVNVCCVFLLAKVLKCLKIK